MTISDTLREDLENLCFEIVQLKDGIYRFYVHKFLLLLKDPDTDAEYEKQYGPILDRDESKLGSIQAELKALLIEYSLDLSNLPIRIQDALKPTEEWNFYAEPAN
jgi:hypothetical protein